MAGPLTRNLTILMTDIKGFTDKTSRRSRSDIQQMLDDHKSVVLPVLEGRGGRLIKTIGDAFLMVFESPTDAVLAGIAVQDALREHNEGEAEDDRIEIRVAINSGEVNLIENDVYGEAVNITARIESIAQAGEVFFTEAVYLSMNKTEVPSSEVGLLQLKGIPEKVRVYKVKRERPVEGVVETAAQAKGRILDFGRKLAGAAPLEASEKAASAGRKPKISSRALALVIDFIVCSILVGMLFTRESGSVRVHKSLKSTTAESVDARGKVEFTEKGMRIRGEGKTVDIGENGIAVSGDAKRPRKEVQVRVDGESISIDEEDADLSEDDGKWHVRKETRRRSVAFPMFWLFYNTLFLGLWAATPGKHVMKLRVVQVNGLRLEWKHAFTRALVSLLSGYAVLIGYLWAKWEKDQRTWHDLLAQTVVIPAEPPAA